MSLQKSLSSRRFQSNIQSHSKNKLINSLINQKLSEERQLVKTRFVNLVKKVSDQKEVQRPSSSSQFKVRKRISSLKNINVPMEKIKQSVTFNPVKQLSQEAQFVISRQYKSPIVSESRIQEVTMARQNSNLVEVKLGEKDKGFGYLSLESIIKGDSQSKQFQPQRQQNQIPLDWIRKLQDELDNQLWLPSLPHTQMLLENLDENNQILKVDNKDLNSLLVVKSPNFTSHGNGFTPVKSILQDKFNKSTSLVQTNKNSKLLQNIKTQKQQIVYDFKKYHKDDFMALQKWFQANIQLAHKRYSPYEVVKRRSKHFVEQKDEQGSQKNNKQFLNILYSIHIGGFQQLIRLNYVETWQKALTLEKFFWSLIRLFGTLVEQQHRINYSEYKGFRRELRQQRVMYEDRCEKLQKTMVLYKDKSEENEELLRKLSFAYVTYSRVNHHLSQQLQFMKKNSSQIESSFSYLNLKMMRLIDHLKMEDKIKVIADQHETTYYLIVGREKLQELIRVKTEAEEAKRISKKKVEEQVEERLKKQDRLTFNKHNHQKDRNSIEKQIIAKRSIIEQSYQQKPIFQTRLGERISQMEHELNKYWVNKENNLQINNIVHSKLLNYQTHEIGVSTFEPFQHIEFGMQFPQKEEKSFAEYLKEEMEKERQNFEKERKQHEDLYVSLKELYQESYGRIRTLEERNKQLQKELSYKDSIINSQQNKITLLEEEANHKQGQLQERLNQIQQLKINNQSLQSTITELRSVIQQSERRFQLELQNSQNLVRNNIMLKQKLQKLTIKQTQLQNQMHQINTQKQHIQIQLQQIQQQSNNYKSQFQTLHNKLLKISPFVDKFLQFRRYDLECVIITDLKRELEKEFPDYFCKDSDLFLTKG